MMAQKKLEDFFQYGVESAGLKPVLSQTEKSCKAPNYRQFSTNIKIKIIKLIARGAEGPG